MGLFTRDPLPAAGHAPLDLEHAVASPYAAPAGVLRYDGRVPPPGAPPHTRHDYQPAPVPPPQVAPRRRSRLRWPLRIVAAAIVLFVLLVGYLAITAPLSKSLQPIAAPSITLTAADGTAIARRGAIIEAPVDAATLPPNVTNAFIAIEDRSFRAHWGISLRGIARAMFHNITSSGRDQGASTITQQLAKNAFLDSNRTFGRKLREMMIAFWLEAWLTKDQILSRYLSSVYFGDNVYGLRAAARHYFNRPPEQLTIAQSAMLAGLVKAPSRLNPTVNLAGARARQAVVVGAMQDAGFITRAEADATRPARLNVVGANNLPTGTYFADWVLPIARDQSGDVATQTTIRTTLDRRLQRLAEQAARGSGLRQAQVALVAMHPDGQVVAMVGGRDYARSPFNRATQAQRQPGSAFKLFLYLAALRSGMTPDTMVEDSPITIGGWSPHNSDGRYEGQITLRRAFAKSSNVVAARLIQRVGPRAVIQAARDLGISTPIPNEATIALGTSTVSLLELTQAYAGVAAGRYPVVSHGLQPVEEPGGEGMGGWLDTLTARGNHALDGTLRSQLLDLLAANATTGTGRAAALPIPTYGKTGTTQDSRDAWFVGFAGDLVVGVWVGNDDNTPNAGLSGGGVPARIWHGFMMNALNLSAPVATAPTDEGDKAGADEGTPSQDQATIGGDAGGDTPPRDDEGTAPDDRAPPPKEPEE